MTNDKPLPPALRKNASDHTAMALRAVLANIPFAGAAIVELINEVIPNQRDERLRKYVVQLALKVEEFENRETALRNLSAEKVALFEDGATGSARATTDDRINHLVNLVAVGLRGADRVTEDQRAIVRLLNELTEADLRYLMLQTDKYGDDKNWRAQNGFNWSAEVKPDGTPAQVSDDVAEMYILGRLISMGLMRLTYTVEKGKRSRFARDEEDQPGVVEIDSSEIEPAGLSLLRRLGLLGPNEK